MLSTSGTNFLIIDSPADELSWLRYVYARLYLEVANQQKVDVKSEYCGKSIKTAFISTEFNILNEITTETIVREFGWKSRRKRS